MGSINNMTLWWDWSLDLILFCFCTSVIASSLCSFFQIFAAAHFYCIFALHGIKAATLRGSSLISLGKYQTRNRMDTTDHCIICKMEESSNADRSPVLMGSWKGTIWLGKCLEFLPFPSCSFHGRWGYWRWKDVLAGLGDETWSQVVGWKQQLAFGRIRFR